MIRHFCDICNKELSFSDTDRPSTIQWYKLSKVTYSFGGRSGEIETASTEICNDCLKAIVSETTRKGVI